MGNPRAVHAFKELVKLHKIHFIFLSETLEHSGRIEDLLVQLG